MHSDLLVSREHLQIGQWKVGTEAQRNRLTATMGRVVDIVEERSPASGLFFDISLYGMTSRH